MQAIRDFLLQSPCKFKVENIIMLLDPTFEEIKKGMEELRTRARARSKKHPTNIFLGYSGHGTSIRG